MIAQAVRSALFYLLYLGQTTILALVIGSIAITRGRTPLGWALARYWGQSNLVFLRWMVGIKSRVEGTQHIPPGGCIIAAKHQSDWDIFAILPHTQGKPAFIAKRQLLDIPFFGWAARAFDTIRVDRSRGGEAVPMMLADARASIGKGCKIVIFPEGTRRAPLDEPDYRYGVARLYSALNVPVVPVALNSGLFWGRNSLLLWPGTAKARFLPPIHPGLGEAEFMAALQDAIETGTNELIAEAHIAGLARPIPPDLRTKLDALAGFKPMED